MTTTAVRTPPAVPYRADVMNECFKLAPRSGNAPPRIEDACQVGVMRRITAARLRRCGLELMTDAVMLIVSELLTNAVLHSGGTEIQLSVTVRDGFLHIAVCDGMPGRAERRPADGDAESGRGLALIEALVAESGGAWGTSDAGSTTWCDLTISDQVKST